MRCDNRQGSRWIFVERKGIVLCASNNKEMYQIKRRVHEIDPDAFTMIVESNEVVGEGFQEGSFD